MDKKLVWRELIQLNSKGSIHASGECPNNEVRGKTSGVTFITKHVLG